jgi:hypothetical protein
MEGRNKTSPGVVAPTLNLVPIFQQGQTGTVLAGHLDHGGVRKSAFVLWGPMGLYQGKSNMDTKFWPSNTEVRPRSDCMNDTGRRPAYRLIPLLSQLPVDLCSTPLPIQAATLPCRSFRYRREMGKVDPL